MNKGILFLIFFCLLSALFMTFFKPMTKASQSLKIQPIQPIVHQISSPAAVSLPDNSVAQAVSAIAPRTEVCNSSPKFEPVNANSVTNQEKGAAENEEYRLLRELRAVAATNVESALAGAMAFPEGNERNRVLAAVSLGFAQTDPADAVKLAEKLQLGGQGGGIMENLVQQWATADLPSALEWLNSQPQNEQRDEFTMRIAYVLSQTDPSDAASLVMNQIAAGAAQNDAIITVLHQWANQDMAAAVNWARGFSDEALRVRALTELSGMANRR